jgi:ABC-type phosphate/phosphonate transport system substrate-binding protein
MRALIAIVGAAALVALAAGCGGSSSSSKSDWEVISSTQVKGRSPAGFLHARVARPSDVEIKVDSTPPVKVKTTYTIVCGDQLDDDAPGRKTRPGASGNTPVTTTVQMLPGPPAPCLITAVATKTSPAEMTVTLLSRSAPA